MLKVAPLFAVFMCMRSIAAESEATATATKAINSLGLELLGRTGKPDQNALLSPYSIQSALAMTYAGADGVTRKEMWGSRNFKLGDKVFVCWAPSAGGILVEFKLSLDEQRAALATGLAKPHGRGNHAAHGWVAVNLTRKADVPTVMRWIKQSRALYKYVLSLSNTL